MQSVVASRRRCASNRTPDTGSRPARPLPRLGLNQATSTPSGLAIQVHTASRTSTISPVLDSSTRPETITAFEAKSSIDARASHGNCATCHACTKPAMRISVASARSAVSGAYVPGAPLAGDDPRRSRASLWQSSADQHSPRPRTRGRCGGSSPVPRTDRAAIHGHGGRARCRRSLQRPSHDIRADCRELLARRPSRPTTTRVTTLRDELDHRGQPGGLGSARSRPPPIPRARIPAGAGLMPPADLRQAGGPSAGGCEEPYADGSLYRLARGSATGLARNRDASHGVHAPGGESWRRAQPAG